MTSSNFKRVFKRYKPIMTENTILMIDFCESYEKYKEDEGV